MNTSFNLYGFDSFPAKTSTGTFTNSKFLHILVFDYKRKSLVNFSNIVGLKKNTLYPPTSNNTSNYAVISKDEGLIPNDNPVNCILVRCDLVKNDLSVPGDVLFSFNASSSIYGKNINIQQNNVAMLRTGIGLSPNMYPKFFICED